MSAGPLFAALVVAPCGGVKLESSSGLVATSHHLRVDVSAIPRPRDVMSGGHIAVEVVFLGLGLFAVWFARRHQQCGTLTHAGRRA